jgi:hypothetical protein
MLNHNIISLILKKAHKCHCMKDALNEYCFDHITNSDDYRYMTIEDYIDKKYLINRYDITLALREGNYFTPIILKITDLYFKFYVRWSVDDGRIFCSQSFVYNRDTETFKDNLKRDVSKRMIYMYQLEKHIKKNIYKSKSREKYKLRLLFYKN